jgi:hypothetical protein
MCAGKKFGQQPAERTRRNKKNAFIMFCSFVATQVTWHMSGLLYERRTAVVVHATQEFSVFPVLL